MLIPEILALRRERTALLGYDSFAALRFATMKAGTPDAVARREKFNGALEPWDWRFYAKKVHQADDALSEAEMKPCFVFEAIQQAAFDTATRLFWVTFTPIADVALYYSDVQGGVAAESAVGGRHPELDGALCRLSATGAEHGGIATGDCQEFRVWGP